MKILLCISKTPDTTSKINFTPDGKSLESAGVQFILNPYDDHALSAAMSLKEKHGATITVIHVGDATGEAMIRKCLAVGADEAIRVDSHALDSSFVAQCIAEASSATPYDLVMCGRESIDFNGSAVPEMVAELMGISSISFVTKIDIDGESAVVNRFIDGGEEKLQVRLPLLISCTKEMGEPRIANMRGIMAARSKPITVIPPAKAKAFTRTITMVQPTKKKQTVFIEPGNAGKLIDMLHNEDRVI